MDNLKACPFCGNPFIVLKSATGGYILKHVFENCPIYANGKTGPVYPRKKDLIDELNTRPLEDAANARAEKAEARAERLQAAVMLILDCVDYTSGACGLTEMIGAVLPRQIIDRARAALKGGEE